MQKSTYVDDLVSGVLTVEQAKTHKEIAREILRDATLELHKWSSNVPQVEARENQQMANPQTEQSYAKTQLMVKPEESKILSLKLDNKTTH